ncbi:MarR family winged helix-turn-helix transcriptional regulator [Streptomyces sp. NPDC059740]|uniref:MarR family winged helix-turn-helix transcriptional regulator n=1 Tax=Streptomyces sp. NPDC059740 TaxID=3346926 RepID=UPI003655F4CB
MTSAAKDPCDPHHAAGEDQAFGEFTQAFGEMLVAVRRSRGRLAGEVDRSLSLSRIHLLEALADHGPQGVGDIALHAGVSAPTATRMLKNLERDGIVTRTRTAGNERRVEVALTDHGAALLHDHRDRLRARQQRAYRELTPEERSVITDVTRRLTELIDDI